MRVGVGGEHDCSASRSGERAAPPSLLGGEGWGEGALRWAMEQAPPHPAHAPASPPRGEAIRGPADSIHVPAIRIRKVCHPHALNRACVA